MHWGVIRRHRSQREEMQWKKEIRKKMTNAKVLNE